MSVPTGYKAYRSYKDKDEARGVVAKLRKQGKQVTTREVTVKHKGMLIRVFVK